MDCKYVRETACLCFTFSPEGSSLFYLTNTKNRLRIVEENLYTGLIMNEFPVPLKQQNLNVDNYIINYDGQGRQVILTLYNHILVYCLKKKILIFVGQAQGKNPYFIQKAVARKNFLYFSATDQHSLFAVNIQQSINSSAINNYLKFKLPPEVLSINIAVNSNKLVAICTDFNLRVWDADSTNSLKGAALQRIGEPNCLSFSKNGQYLLIGTKDGYVQVWDGNNLGVQNTIVMSKQISKQLVQSLSWFHYSGEAQSKRFLVYTSDGNVKLYSLFFQKMKDSKDKYIGKANQLSLLYICRNKMGEQFEIRSHQYANFIYFHPGVLLYMVDYYPRIYYPIISKQITHSFESLTPNNKKEIYFQGDFLFVQNLFIKRLRNQIQTKIPLGSVLEYQDLKILKMDYRPKIAQINQLPLSIQKNIPSQKIRYKFLITYYLGNMVRLLVLSNIYLSNSNDTIQNFKEYSGHSGIFLGPNKNLDPLILILQEDKQTITVVSETALTQTSLYHQEEKKYLRSAGQIYTKQLKIKIQRIYETPFRNSYVLLYQSENLIRFSNNIHVNSELVDYDVYNSLSLRLDYTDIVIDIAWTSRGEIGCVVCLEKLIFITDELKQIKSVNIEGYIIQGQFVGYTLVVTTKVDVQYVDVSCRSTQLYCIQNYESRYLILGILADRVIGIERFNNTINCKCRYFNLMEPLLAGYINYYQLANVPMNPQSMKAIIEGFAPYHIVSEEFILLLNQNGFSNFSKYFIESNIKLYSRRIRSNTINTDLRMERFINPKVWLKNKSNILDYFLYYEDLKDSHDNYQIEKSKEYDRKLRILIGPQNLHAIKQAYKQQNGRMRMTLANSFGEKSLFQVYYEYNQKENIFIKMEIDPFKAQNVGEWVGIFPIYLESKAGDNETQVLNMEEPKEQEKNGADSNEEGGQFKDLLVYYRFDDGKGEVVDDLSDYANEGSISIEQVDPWNLLDQEPMELLDKWGKKCPPQYSIIKRIVQRQKKINGKNLTNFSFQIWIKSEQGSFCLLKIGHNFEFGLKNGIFYYKSSSVTILQGHSEDFQFIPGAWVNVSFTYSHSEKTINLYLNSFPFCKVKGELKLSRQHLIIGSPEMNGEFTEFRLWKKQLTHEDIKQNLRTPLEIVAQKRKRLRMKIKEKKKERTSGNNQFPAFSF